MSSEDKKFCHGLLFVSFVIQVLMTLALLMAISAECTP